ncbi:hypothetical protein HDU96_003259 [Phlyctochytrium bullatum]|nr:hypothetical protein HDU96_003259 [Phlyctochytrium bullatum]
MATLEDLHDVFERFAQFGSNRNLSSNSALDSSLLSLNGGITLDGPRFAKFARDTGLVDGKRITATDIDIIFNKVKSKGNRRIDWPVFLEGVQLIAEKRYPDKASQQAMNCILYDICIRSPAGPAKAATTSVQNDAVLDRLTDITGYTGTHKARFDENGIGRGLAGRDQPSRTDRLDKIVGTRAEPLAPLAGAKRVATLTASEERLDMSANLPKKEKGPMSGGPSRSLTGSSSSLASVPSKSASSLAPITSMKGGPKDNSNVFDRLTNSNGYTGTHKHRFTSTGVGRGLAGRDSIPKNGVGVYRGGDVKELSQILRPGF